MSTYELPQPDGAPEPYAQSPPSQRHSAVLYRGSIFSPQTPFPSNATPHAAPHTPSSAQPAPGGSAPSAPASSRNRKLNTQFSNYSYLREILVLKYSTSS